MLSVRTARLPNLIESARRARRATACGRRDMQRRPLLASPALALLALAAAEHVHHTPQEKLARLSISECAREIFLNCSFDRHTAEAGVVPKLQVDHIYVLHYKGNTKRHAYQMQQLPQVGVNFSLVTGYDRDEILPHNRACVLTNTPRLDLDLGGNKSLDMHTPDRPPYVSQVIKLYAALHDMLANGHTTALIMEDDAVVRFDNLPGLDKALGSLAGNYTIIYSGSYNPKGTDGLPGGLYPKDLSHIPGYRGPGRMMPAVGCVLSVAGAAHVLETLPIRAPVDMSLSDWRVPSAPRHRSFVFKPYAFNPGGFGTSGIFGCEGIACDIENQKKAAAAAAAASRHQKAGGR